MGVMEISRSYRGELEVVSPLHVGSGSFDSRDGIPGATGANKAPQVALIMRDGDNNPYIPGTTIKGLLRRLFDDQDVEFMAGEIKDSEVEGGRMGAVMVRGARFLAAGPTEALPFTEKLDKTEVGEGVFVAARTAIDDETGTVADAKLFFQEMVAPKSVFSFEVVVAPHARSTITDAGAKLEAALRQLAGMDGVSIGKGQADGFGRIRIKGGKLITRSRTIDTTSGEVTDGQPKTVALTADPRPAAFTISFSCPGPFIIADASRGKEHKPGESKEDRKKGEAHSRPQKLGADLPLILGSSVSGALRARAEWLAAVLNLAIPDEKGLIADARHLPKDPVNQLFGVTGYRGLLSIRGMDVSTAKLWDVTSVQLDRFSGAPVDNALFTTEVFVGARFSITFGIDARGKADPALPWRERLDAASVRLLDALIDDLRTNGLQIGAGGNKGFGWFDADVVEGGQNG